MIEHNRWINGNSIQKGDEREFISRLGVIRSLILDFFLALDDKHARYLQGTAQSVTNTNSVSSSRCSFVFAQIQTHQWARRLQIFVIFLHSVSYNFMFGSKVSKSDLSRHCHPRGRKSMMATSVVTPRSLSSRATSRGGIG